MTFRPGWLVFRLVAALLMVGGAVPAHALKFEELKLKDDQWVLVARDCGIDPGDSKCPEEQTMFSGEGNYPRSAPQRHYAGDAAELKNWLGKRAFAEVWLWSRGGDLDEGVEFGKVLRSQFQSTVRVPAGAYCVSACTVAFMGGLFRLVDEDDSYKVHAYSRFLTGFSDVFRAEFLSDPERALRTFARKEQKDAREWAVRLMSYFQEGLRGAPNQQNFRKWLTTTPPDPLYLTSPDLKQDAEKIRLERDTAIQEILMKIERTSMEEAIKELRPRLSELGPRAEPALTMLETMFTSRITLTAILTRETLLKMGYITRIVQP